MTCANPNIKHLSLTSDKGRNDIRKHTLGQQQTLGIIVRKVVKSAGQLMVKETICIAQKSEKNSEKDKEYLLSFLHSVMKL